jgi:predicted nucleic acid-binding protein
LLKDFEPKSSHSYLIDTNILMYLFSPIASYEVKHQEQISRFLDSCRRVNAGIITTASIIGEFFHVNLNIYFENWCKEQRTKNHFILKRDFRPTDDYKDCVAAINQSINGILRLSERFPDGYNSVSMADINDHCYHAEFTDSYLLELCNTKDWIIVSNDKDLLNHPNRRTPLIALRN